VPFESRHARYSSRAPPDPDGANALARDVAYGVPGSPIGRTPVVTHRVPSRDESLLLFERRTRGVGSVPAAAAARQPACATAEPIPRFQGWRVHGTGALADRGGVRGRALLRPVCGAAIPERRTSRGDLQAGRKFQGRGHRDVGACRNRLRHDLCGFLHRWKHRGPFRHPGSGFLLYRLGRRVLRPWWLLRRDEQRRIRRCKL